MFAGYKPYAACVQWTDAEVANTNHARMSVYLTVNDVCRCKNKPVGIVIRGKYNRKLGLENLWHMADTAVGIVPRNLTLAEIR